MAIKDWLKDVAGTETMSYSASQASKISYLMLFVLVNKLNGFERITHVGVLLVVLRHIIKYCMYVYIYISSDFVLYNEGLWFSGKVWLRTMLHLASQIKLWEQSWEQVT